MSSPLIMQATDCAGDGETPPASTASATAQPVIRDLRRRWESVGVVMVMSAVSTNWHRGGGGYSSAGSGTALLNAAGTGGRRRRIRDGPQADLQHKTVTEHRRRRPGRVGVGRDVIGGQHKA